MFRWLHLRPLYLTYNAFGLEGRHWYPYIFPSFLCFVWYAPRALTKRHRVLSAVLTGTLLCYAAIAAAYALIDVNARYYGAPSDRYELASLSSTQSVNWRVPGVLWPLESAEYHVNGGNAQFSFPLRSRLSASGGFWLDGDTDPDAAVLVDGRVGVPVLAGQYLWGVAEATHNVAYGYSGFFAEIRTARLEEGAHTVVAYARLPNATQYAPIAPLRLFFLTARPEFFLTGFSPGSPPRRLLRAPSQAWARARG